jgi:hypothetical protein
MHRLPREVLRKRDRHRASTKFRLGVTSPRTFQTALENGRRILKRILKKYEGVDWIHLAQDRDQWRAVVKTVMNVRIPQKAGNVLTS